MAQIELMRSLDVLHGRRKVVKTRKTYTAEEVINRIKNGWRSAEELRALYEFLERVEMASDAELEKLCDSGYTNLIYDAYQPDSVE